MSGRCAWQALPSQAARSEAIVFLVQYPRSYLLSAIDISLYGDINTKTLRELRIPRINFHYDHHLQTPQARLINWRAVN